MAVRDVQWFDLGRFGAQLRVVPKDPLRGIALTCLEITDVERYERSVGYSAERPLSDEAKAECRAQQMRVLAALGFATTPHRRRVVDADDMVHTTLRFFSTTTEFTLRDLRQLLPDLGPQDLRRMPAAAIALTGPLIAPWEPGDADVWAGFARDVLAKEAVGVWTLAPNPFEGPWERAGTLRERSGRPRHEALGFALVPTYSQMVEHLERAQVRDNALVGFYVELEDALAAGHRPSELRKVDLPFALPLWVERDACVVALKDVRFAPEIMGFPPEKAFRSSRDGGLVVAALRELPALRRRVEVEVEQWKAWGAEPEGVTGRAFQASVENVVGARVEFLARHPRWVDNTRGLVERTAENAPLRVKPVAALRDHDMLQVVDIASSFSPAAAGERAVLVGLATKLLQRAHEALADEARAQAKEQLQRVAEAVKDSVESGERGKHVDAGAKIGGARKDFTKRWMVAEDVEAMTELERKQLVVKANVYPALDYRGMRDAGIEPQVAMGIKVLKDALATAPSQEREESGDRTIAYIHALGLVRDRLALVHTKEELFAAMTELCQAGRRSSDGTLTRYISGGSDLQRQWGRDFSQMIWEGADGCMPRKMREQIERHVDRYIRREPDDPGAGWAKLIQAPRVKSDAEKQAEREKNEGEAELHRPHLEHVQRVGEDWRGGRDMSADAILQYFGFRAVEFGNWLPQDERQSVLNMAFDSLCDLAHALALPPKALSLEGDLAIAFGSRGTGGRRAALAHFEPSRMAMNLTRMKGAGTLAHEWLHALDFYLGDKKGYASEGGRSQSAAMLELTFRMQYRPYEPEELLEVVRSNASKGRDNAVAWMYQQGDAAKKAASGFMRDAFERATLAFAESAGRTLQGLAGSPYAGQLLANDAAAVDGAVMADWGDRMLRGLRDLADVRPAWNSARDKVDQNLRWGLRNLAVQVTMDVARDVDFALPPGFFGGSRSTVSRYFEQAKALDAQRSSPYWATVREMFARAGAAYVHDRLEGLGYQSDYLVYGSDAARYAEHAIGNPNPNMGDRKALAAHFDRVFQEYRLQCVHRSEASAEAS